MEILIAESLGMTVGTRVRVQGLSALVGS